MFSGSEMCELEPCSKSLTRSLMEGEERRQTYLPPSFSGSHGGPSQQGQRPKTVEATIRVFQRNIMSSSSALNVT
jgi:hypothetical protein